MGAVIAQEIEIPVEVDPDSAAAIRSHIERLRAAQARADLSDVVGCAKEVAESVARVVLAARGEIIGNGASFKELITAAHRAVDRQPGEGLATDPSVKKMAQSAKGLVQELGQLRNDVGTGHGRATEPAALEEHAEIAADAVTIWARWVLRRLPAYIHSDLAALIRMLDDGGTFYEGTLRRRLEAIDLSNLAADDAQLPARLDEITSMITTAGWIAPYGSRSTTFEAVSEAALAATHRFPVEAREQWSAAWSRQPERGRP